jgi:hypothetical protein
MTIVPENIANRMDPADRKANKIKTAAESIEEAAVKSEKAEHRTYLAWCGLNDIPCREDRMDKRVTGTVGWPDFIVIYGGRALLLEFKIYGNKLSDNQKAVHAQLARTATDVLVCYSADEAIRKTRGWLWEHFRWEPKV